MSFDFDFIPSSLNEQMKMQLAPLQTALPKEQNQYLYDSLSLSRSPTERATKKSTYWKVPDREEFLTDLVVNSNDNLCAISSGTKNNNLFIYEMTPGHRSSSGSPALYHHHTITLPQIHALSWVSNETQLGRQGDLLVSGHKDGVANLTLLPGIHSDSPAEILSRFNHQYHIGSNESTRVRALGLTMGAWNCAPENSLATLCADSFFLWDVSRTDMPILKQKSRGVLSFNLCSLRDGVVATGGKRGISIRDVRAARAGLSPPTDNDGPVSCVRWSPENENLVAASHGDIVRVWDIRSTKPLSTYNGHNAAVSALEWLPNCRQEELLSASHDGTVRMWNIHDVSQNSAASNKAKSSITISPISTVGSESWSSYHRRVQQRTVLPPWQEDNQLEAPLESQNKHFTAMRLAGQSTAVTIDAEGYFGLHPLNRAPGSPASSSHSDSSEGDFLPPLNLNSP